jgi:hypothetical protein
MRHDYARINVCVFLSLLRHSLTELWPPPRGENTRLIIAHPADRGQIPPEAKKVNEIVAPLAQLNGAFQFRWSDALSMMNSPDRKKLDKFIEYGRYGTSTRGRFRLTHRVAHPSHRVGDTPQGWGLGVAASVQDTSPLTRGPRLLPRPYGTYTPTYPFRPPLLPVHGGGQVVEGRRQ